MRKIEVKITQKDNQFTVATDLLMLTDGDLITDACKSGEGDNLGKVFKRVNRMIEKDLEKVGLGWVKLPCPNEGNFDFIKDFLARNPQGHIEIKDKSITPYA